MAADAMVEDVNYTMITDVQISERAKTQVQTDNVAVLRQGTSGKCKPAPKPVISINTRRALSPVRIKLISSS
jgi:hypothetical protein